LTLASEEMTFGKTRSHGNPNFDQSKQTVSNHVTIKISGHHAEHQRFPYQQLKTGTPIEIFGCHVTLLVMEPRANYWIAN
jgi:hypothetical protein